MAERYAACRVHATRLQRTAISFINPHLSMLSRQARAKVNLGLHVLRKRSDGYHDLETVLLPIEWTDTLTLEPAHTLSFTCDDQAIAGNANLVMRAAHALREHFDVEKGARIHLAKRIPYGAGLGGGSSDAATALRLLVELWDLSDADHELYEIGSRLGSDVPFFLQEEAALATGRGTDLNPLSSNDEAYAFPFDLVVAVPETRISTPEAYSLVAPRDTGRPDLTELIKSNDPERWRREMVNDFEEAILDAFPEIAALKQSLYDAGAAYASMSGSGSAVYGVFEDGARATAAAEALRGSGHRVWQG